jgi:hypothetical protein
MAEKTPLSTVFRPANRFLRSTELVRDFEDPNALNGYCLTEFGKHCFSRIAVGLENGSSARAWRLTGDYGSGKSSFALLLAAAFADEQRLPKHLQQEVVSLNPQVRNARYVPLLVTGTREALSIVIVRRLLELHQRLFVKGAKSSLEERLGKYSRQNDPITDEIVVRLISEVTEKIVSQKKGRGLLLVLDEVGKFLEFAALSPEKQDIFLVQKLAEFASRSGKEPFVLVCLLHQGFSAYADALSNSNKREWEKIAGRLEEIRFQHPLDQIVLLLASALNVDMEKVDARHLKSLEGSMDSAIRLGWFGASSSRSTLRRHAPALFPIDPFVVPVLVRTFQRYGQNERSIFSFLFSYESLGLHAFASMALNAATPYRLHHFYDYVRANLGHRLAVASYRSHWAVIESVVDTFPSANELENQVMKTIGIINLLNTDELLPTEEALCWAVAGPDVKGHEMVRQALRRLRTARAVFFRGENRGFCLWPHLSVDIEARFDEAKREIASVGSVGKAISGLLDTRPIVARRHYIATGNLRFLRVIYCSVPEALKYASIEPTDADGTILVPLCENEREHREALRLGPQLSVVQKRDYIRLVAVPRPLNQLSGVILDSLRWDWVITNTGDLNSDRYAREEVSRFRTDAQNRLEQAVQGFVGLNRTSSRFQLAWFSQGEAVRLDSGRELLSYISELCDEAFPKAPHIHNELVNRRLLSSAAAAARMRLIELMFSSADQPGLGIDVSKNPPEKSIYLSVLRGTGLHHEKTPGRWALGEPDGADPCKVRNALREIQALLEKHADRRLSVEILSQELRRPPFGLRDGIIPIFLAVIAISQRREIAVYENGTFLREVGKDAFLRMSKSPEKFDIQYCRIEGVRAELFEKLIGILALSNRKGKDTELLDLVHELCQVVAKLPEYTRNTKRLPKRALAVRDAILQAQEPVQLVFHELPEACGFPRFGPAAPVTPREAHSFANALKDALDEIRQAYPILESRILKSLAQQFDYGRKNLDGLRRELADRAEKVSTIVADVRLKGFSLRLEDTFLSQEQWIDSVGSFLGLRPPTKWKDDDEDVFARELAVIAGRFKRTEAMAFATSKDKTGSNAIRVALTQADGTERQQVLFVSKEDEKDLHRLKGQIARLVNEYPQVGIAAASQAIWDQLKIVSD